MIDRDARLMAGIAIIGVVIVAVLTEFNLIG